MAVVGWMGAGMEVVVGRHAGQSQGVDLMSGDAGALPVCEVNTLIIPDLTTIQVRSSGCDRVGIGWLSWKGLSTGLLEKAPDRCQCSRMVALHGAPRTHMPMLNYSKSSEITTGQLRQNDVEQIIGRTSINNNINSARGAPWSAANRLHGQRSGAFLWRPVLRPFQEDRPIPARPHPELVTWTAM